MPIKNTVHIIATLFSTGALWYIGRSKSVFVSLEGIRLKIMDILFLENTSLF